MTPTLRRPLSTTFTHLTTDTYQAALYPSPGPQNNASTPKLGVCLSGGGSRALTCALGQLSGLRSLKDPSSQTQTLLDRVDYLSSVSGGSWASVLFTFLPPTIGGKPVTDDDFLISPQTPDALVKKAESVAEPQNVSYLAPFSLGKVPGQFNVTNIADLLFKMYNWGLFGSSEKRRWWWIAAVGELVLKPFELFDAFFDPNVNFLQPSHFFSLSDQHIATTITPSNQTLKPDQFYVTRKNRPPLFVNTNLIQDLQIANPAQIPIQANAIDTGIVGQSPDGTIGGGGGVESFAFTSTLTGKGKASDLAEVTTDRRYSLCDIAGCSSAFFAAALLAYINKFVLDDVIAEIRKFLESEGIKGLLLKVLIEAIKSKLEKFVDIEASEVIPQYDYWPLGEVGNNPPANVTYGFSDGGNFDNTGILGLLARTDANRVVSFVNNETPLSQDPNSKQILVDTQLPLLFGYMAKPVNGQYVSFGGMNPKQPMSYVQVFSDANHEFAKLRQGLFDASTGGSGREADLGADIAAFMQSLTTVDNPVANIKAGRQITVLWVYNNRVNKWQNAIIDAGIKADLQRGQAASPSGPLMNFPHYGTAIQLELGPEPVNMLAQLSAWNVQQLKPLIDQLLS